MESNIDYVLSRLEGVKSIGTDQWISRCPAHTDRTPSLSIGIGAEGQILLYCFAGCTVEDVAKSIGLDISELWPDSGENASPEERRLRKLEAEQAKMQRDLVDQRERIEALEKIHQCTDHIDYHANLKRYADAMTYWVLQGMTAESIESYQLGYCQRCTMDYPALRPSYTIPVISNGMLWNIRHRLIGEDSSKYRPHMKGLPNVLFNADDLRSGDETIYIFEGEKKSIIGAQNGWHNVGIMGKRGFKPEWAAKFKAFRRVVVALDPDAGDRAIEIAGLFKGRGYIAELPEKMDDMLNPYGDIQSSRNDVEYFLRRARKV